MSGAKNFRMMKGGSMQSVDDSSEHHSQNNVNRCYKFLTIPSHTHFSRVVEDSGRIRYRIKWDMHPFVRIVSRAHALSQSTMKKESHNGEYTSPDGSATWEYIGVISCASLIFCNGLVSGWNSPTLGKLRGPDSPIELSSSDASTLTSMGALGHALAPVFTVFMADKLGRKKSLLVTGIPSIISWVMILTSQHIVVLFVARFIAGTAVGLNMCISPMYLGEIASANLRGAIGMVCGIMSNAGQVFMYAMVPYISVSMAACICLSIAAASTMGAWFIPESPYFFEMVGRFDEAEGTLEKLRGKTDVSEELELIKNTVSQKDDPGLNEKGLNGEAPMNPSAFKLLFTVPGNRKALGILLLFATAVNLGSYIVIVIYGDIIFTKMNTRVGSQLSMLIIGVIQLVSNVLVAFVIDKAGRKPLILVSGFVSGLCVLIVGVYFYLMEQTDVDVTPYSLIALCALFLNMVAINMGLMPLMMVIQSEILGTDVKALATTFMGVGSGLLASIGAKSYLMVAETWGYGHAPPFFSFAVITWFSTILILKLLPETKGKTLLDIQRALNG